ncbi:acyl-CoA thioester hydrolase [Lysinibacillus composti]|uniref:Acyl-CoA thioesterase n=1 Tax=Lysinibacillus composti TaxID=720633 RepID=A0A3N9UHW5_9BACI|nr:thioesterase family protein [Lysinibacillus composti]MBM7607812.1 acyl-CoA thioester hydrolase [Lysinibacillus composti]RQW75703.1 acyl-CoA thioesterase [Lysinibacillus composti]
MFVSEKQIEIRYAETDQMGVVYHANYLIWMEIGRTQLIHDLGFDYAKLEEQGYISPVLDLTVQYKKAMRYGQVATVRTWVESHDKLRTTYGYEILHEDGSIAATGTTLNTLVKRENLRPFPLVKADPAWDAKYKEIARSQQ